MTREKLCLAVTAAICLCGCALLSWINVREANYSRAELIPSSEYSVGIALPASGQEQNAAASGSDSGTININTASAAELAGFLPGIGEKKAKSIVEYREQAGGFVSVDELLKVDGIGERTLETIRPYCRIRDE